MKIMADARKLAVNALLKVETDGAYSNITLNNIFKQNDASSEEKALASAIFYGVLERRITLDYILSSCVRKPLAKTEPFTLTVLRSALYQIMYMAKIPDSAAVNEAVKLIKHSRESRNAGFVNAVLRAALRSEHKLPDGASAKALSVRYSVAEWIAESLISDYGAETAEMLLRESLKPAPITLRVNTLKTSVPALAKELESRGIPAAAGDIGGLLYLEKGMDIASSDLYKQGFFHVQDAASQKAVSVLAPKADERLLDLCAAPGGKSFTAAELMENRGEVISCDLYEQRVRLISESAARLGLSIIRTAVSDASVYDPSFGEFDCVLCDVPCSGLGVMRRKPEIKYKYADGLDELAEIQYNILCTAAKYLKKGGRLLYSTCTLRREENEGVVNRFLNEYNEYNKMYEYTFMPHIDKTDGFYCALLGA